MKSSFSHKNQQLFNKICYAIIFCFVLPSILILWAVQLDKVIPNLPTLDYAWLIAIFCILFGIIFIYIGMRNLWKYGEGLPMNLYPPKKFVSVALYQWIGHPIYLGSVVLMLGIFCLCSLQAGIWIVTPCFTLATMSLIYGFEAKELKARFKDDYIPPRITLPQTNPDFPKIGHRLSAYVFLIIPWGIIYSYLAILLPTNNLHDTFMPFEFTWSVQIWAIIPYLFAYAWILIAPLTAKTQATLRTFIIAGIVGCAIAFLCFLILPFKATPRNFAINSILSNILDLQLNMDTVACALPSLHVFSAFLAAFVIKEKYSAIISYAIALMISISCILISAHSILDVLAGVILYFIAIKYVLIYKYILIGTEYIANSWKEWHKGKIRIINHGFYIFLSCFISLLLIGSFLHHISAITIFLIAITGIIGAGLWGQILESSSQLSRPFGYYGGLFGTIIGILIFGAENIWELFGLFACTAPIIQAIGRFRCLVQGCCHGMICDQAYGIKYYQANSRVVRIANLANQYVYPTQLYSILSNIVIAIILWVLALSHAPSSLIIGLYIILSSCCRFVEESYRGEPQTVTFAKLAIYQWLSTFCLVLGIIFTILPSGQMYLHFVWSYNTLFVAFIVGIFGNFAMGVDFPKSKKRMSRLA